MGKVPLYEYKCKQCGYRFEKIQKFSATPLTVCPKCKGELVRPVTAPALRFKGSGWYVNDYSAKNNAQTSAVAANNTGKSVPASGDSATTTTSNPAAAPAPAAAATSK
jgi:putative FmdB family regulatory protein